MVRQNKKEITHLMAAFLLMCLVSMYRQLSMRFLPNDPARPVVVYFVYLLLLSIWWGAIRNRITQRSMRSFLLAEHALMLMGITIRFLQDAFLPFFTNKIPSEGEEFLMRLSGYAIIVPMILVPLFGVFAAFGLGKTEEYKIHRGWYLLTIPAEVLIILTLTNDYHNLIFRQVEDAQSSLYYNPNIGLFVVIAWAFVLLLSRIFLIYRRSRMLSGYTVLKSVPALIAVFMIAYNIPYVIGSFVVTVELIEFTVAMFFFEAIVWESCIISGMVPVNTHYEEVFDRSTVAMQVLKDDGEPYLKSACATELSTGTFEILKQNAIACAAGIPAEKIENLKQRSVADITDGQEYNLHLIRGGYAIWKNDVARTLAVIDRLKQSADKLEYDGELLRQELKLRSDAAAVREQNQIYNRLTDEVGKQLTLVNNLLKKREWTQDKDLLFRKICLIGTYIKRRCNLRLVEQSDGVISNMELELTYNEIIGCLRQMDIKAEALWSEIPCETSPCEKAPCEETSFKEPSQGASLEKVSQQKTELREAHTLKETMMLSPELAILTLDVFEYLLEYEDFDLHSINIVFETDTAFSIQLLRKDESSGSVAAVQYPSGELPMLKLRHRSSVLPIEELQRVVKDEYEINWQIIEGGYRFSVSTKGA